MNKNIPVPHGYLAYDSKLSWCIKWEDDNNTFRWTLPHEEFHTKLYRLSDYSDNHKLLVWLKATQTHKPLFKLVSV